MEDSKEIKKKKNRILKQKKFNHLFALKYFNILHFIYEFLKQKCIFHKSIFMKFKINK